MFLTNGAFNNLFIYFTISNAFSSALRQFNNNNKETSTLVDQHHQLMNFEEKWNSSTNSRDYYSSIINININETDIIALNASLNNNNNNNNRSIRVVPRISSEIPIWLIPCYSIILFFAVVGNLLVASTLAQNRRMRTITNVFLLNLAISDLLLGVLCMPITLIGAYLRHFIFGELVCKLIQFAQVYNVINIVHSKQYKLELELFLGFGP
uniref:G-protein coupled receptors family 1 profile domain-containing protein n=1 Tax=Glossina brevipalpis TaxID=37001 RepID=A0A1A9WQ25_9MUSC